MSHISCLRVIVCVFFRCPAPLFHNPRLIKGLGTISFQIQNTEAANQSHWQQLIYIDIYIYIFLISSQGAIVKYTNMSSMSFETGLLMGLRFSSCLSIMINFRARAQQQGQPWDEQDSVLTTQMIKEKPRVLEVKQSWNPPARGGVQGCQIYLES